MDEIRPCKSRNQTKRTELCGTGLSAYGLTPWRKAWHPQTFQVVPNYGASPSLLLGLWQRNSLKETKSQIPAHAQLLWAGGRRRHLGARGHCKSVRNKYPETHASSKCVEEGVWSLSLSSQQDICSMHMLKYIWDSQVFGTKVYILDNFSMRSINVYFLVTDFYSDPNFRQLYFSKSQNSKWE